ncbi:unnamed protein product [Orchesella dallaii]|uniref:Transmembrane protein 26 n=1 Tax=Orchesella dallaii TaxID=48710 RepID=A0ABP1QTD5_9HEXA
MAKIIVVLKAILTRIIFGSHGLLAIWRVTEIKNDPYYWYLTASVFALAFEGIFTLTIKKNQEWKWFCPSVFFYLCSVVPAIWLIEVDRFDKRLAFQNQADQVAAAGAAAAGAAAAGNSTKPISIGEIPGLDTFGVDLKIPVEIDPEMWVLVIEQFLMLILIIGRWMLPKGGLTRDQLSQLLLVYIGTAADIIEFFDSFKDDKISRHRILCLLILSIWSWSLLQFTFVLTATKARRTRLTTEVKETPKLKIVNGIIKVREVCCNIDVWAILINIILQDAPFLIFRALLILYYKIITYMNIFFTCKNTLVIILQFYRLYVVQQEKNKELSKIQKACTSKNVANAVERAARMGPHNKEGKARLVKNSASNKRSGPSSKQAKEKRDKHRSQDSISSQNTSKSHSSRRDRNGRRRSLSAGNLPEVGEGETFEDRIYEDDIELGMSGSAMSGTNDPDSHSQNEEESEVPMDEVSMASERPRGPRKNIRMSENPGIYKISGSRSSGGSSERGHGRYRQDTGYSSSSKDSGNSGGRRGRAHNGGRSSGRTATSSTRSRSTAQR